MQLKNLAHLQEAIALSYNTSCWQGAFNNKNLLHSTVMTAIQTDLLHFCRNHCWDTYGFPYIEMSAETSTDTIHLVSYACVTYLNLIKSWTDNRNNAIHCFLAISGSRLLPVQLFLYVMDVFPLGKLLHCFLGHKIESDQGPHSSRQSEEFHDLIWASDRQISQSSDFPSLYQRFYS